MHIGPFLQRQQSRKRRTVHHWLPVGLVFGMSYHRKPSVALEQSQTLQPIEVTVLIESLRRMTAVLRRTPPMPIGRTVTG